MISNTKITADLVNTLLINLNSTPKSGSKKLSEVLLRPQISLSDVFEFVPRETILNCQDSLVRLLSAINEDELVKSEIDTHKLPYFYPVRMFLDLYGSVFLNKVITENSFQDEFVFLCDKVYESVEILIKYSGYIERESRLADKIKRLENVVIPNTFDFDKLNSISTESRQKLNLHRPKNIAEASKIPGVSPADISILLVYFGR
jgi:hypothetical protein